MALFDKLMAAQQGAVAPATAQPVGSPETAKLRQLMLGKLGKADSGQAMSGENLLESQANATAAEQGAQLANQVQTQQAQAQVGEAARQAETTAAVAAQGQAERGQQQDFDTRSDAIINDLERNKEQLSMQDKQARAENMAQLLRMRNDQYVTRLGQEGDIRRLDSDAHFAEEAAKTELGAYEDILRDHLSWSEIMAASDRDFNDQMSHISLSQALSMANTAAQADAAANTFTGLGSASTAGAKYYESHPDMFKGDQSAESVTAGESEATSTNFGPGSETSWGLPTAPAAGT